MKVFFGVLKDMIFCVEDEVAEFVRSIVPKSNKKTSLLFPAESKHSSEFLIKPYFTYIDAMRNELIVRGEKLNSH